MGARAVHCTIRSDKDFSRVRRRALYSPSKTVVISVSTSEHLFDTWSKGITCQEFEHAGTLRRPRLLLGSPGGGFSRTASFSCGFCPRVGTPETRVVEAVWYGRCTDTSRRWSDGARVAVRRPRVTTIAAPMHLARSVWRDGVRPSRCTTASQSRLTRRLFATSLATPGRPL